MLTANQILTLTKVAIVGIGLTPSDGEIEEGYVIVRIRHDNGNFIGSVTIPSSVEHLDEEPAFKFIKAHVLAACRAAMKEPGARA